MVFCQENESAKNTTECKHVGKSVISIKQSQFSDLSYRKALKVDYPHLSL